MKYLSLFSGIGGFEYGIQQSKYAEKMECIGFSEIDKYAKSIYRKHFPEHPDLGDATKINTDELPEFDFLVGGFPCQAFSLAGKRRGFDDTRGTLFFEIARILKDKKPKYFLLENVKGLLSHGGGKLSRKFLKHSPTSGIMLNGRFIIARTMESRRTGNGCILKDILKENVERKYYLSVEQKEKLLARK